MPAFSYVAVDERGRTKRGVVQAEAARHARAGLRSEGLVPIAVEALDTEAASSAASGWRRNRLSSSGVALLTRRLALLLESGLTVEQSLAALIDQQEGEASSRILAAVRGEVMAGHPLAAALGQHPSTFSEIYRALVATGEQSGELAGVMSRLADYLERREAMKQSAGLALLYPAIVAIVALAIVIGLLTYVVPQVVQVFENSRQSLPLLTRAMLWASDALAAGLPAIAVTGALLVFGLRFAYGREPIRERWHARMLRMPVLGTLIRGLDTARLAATLAILLGSGIPLLQALSAGASVVKTLPLRKAVVDAAKRVRDGTSLHRALGGSRMFPPVFIHLVASGEASGQLAHMLVQAARQQEFENDTRIRLLAGVLEPGIILAMGLVVLLVVLAILLPIIEMNQLVRV